MYECVPGGNDAADLDRVAFIDAASGVAIAYAETSSRIEAFARALTVGGVGVGDVATIRAPNIAECAIVFHGFLRAGATATTVDACPPPRKSPSRSVIRTPRCSSSSHRCWSGPSPIPLLGEERQRDHWWRALGATALRAVSGAEAA